MPRLQRSKVDVETKKRIEDSQREGYKPFEGQSYNPGGDWRCYSSELITPCLHSSHYRNIGSMAILVAR